MRYKMFRQLHKDNEKTVEALERAAVFDANVLTEADKIMSCGDIVNTVQCDDCGTNHFKSFVRCKSKFCSLCQKVKSGLWTAHLVDWLRQWLRQGNYVVFLNLTIKDTDTLEEGLKQLEGAWRLMTNKYRKVFLSYFPGGFKSIEVKTGKNSGQWHPHIHALVLKDRYSKDTDFLHYVWPKCVADMGGEAVNIKILPLKMSPGQDKEDFEVELAKNVKEVCKYITKFDWEKEKSERVAEMYEALRGKRQYAVWGALQHVRHEVDADLNTKSDAEVKEFVCQRCGCTSGHPNKLYGVIWGEEEPLMEDYKTTAPEHVASKEEKYNLRVLNGKEQPKNTEWKQDTFSYGNTRHGRFE